MPQEDRGGGNRRTTATERTAEEDDPRLAVTARRRDDRNRDRRVSAAFARLRGDADLAVAELSHALGEVLEGGLLAAVGRRPLEQRFGGGEPLRQALAEEVSEGPPQPDLDGREPPAALAQRLAQHLRPRRLATGPDMLAEQLDDSRLRGRNQGRPAAGAGGLVVRPDPDVDRVG